MRVWSIGEMLWDVFSDQERFGGAPLNFCANLHRMGDEATLISAVGNDERGRLALERMAMLGLNSSKVGMVDSVPTGVAMIHMDSNGEPRYEIPRPAAFDLIDTSETARETALESAAATGVDWLYFGTLLQTSQPVERFTKELAHDLPKTRCFYDMNLRVGQWNLGLVQRLSSLATVIKLNDHEAETLFKQINPSEAEYSLETFCRAWADLYDVEILCVTLGKDGCALFQSGKLQFFEGYQVVVSDTVGSGDAFAAAFLHGYQRDWPLQECARFANAVGALVASRPGATPYWTMAECDSIMHNR